MKLLPTVGSAYSGSMGGLTASHNAGGQYFRYRTIPTNPSSSAQQTLRASVASITQQWSSVLTEAQRLAWAMYAQNVAWTDSLGSEIRLSGVNQYVRSASYATYINNALAASATVPTDAPTVMALGVTPIIGEVTVANAVGPPAAVTLSLPIENAADYSAGDVIAVHVGPSKGPGVNFFDGPYIAVVAADPTTSPVSVDLSVSPYTDRYPMPVEGNKVWGYARVIHADGRLSSRSRFGPGLIPAPA